MARLGGRVPGRRWKRWWVGAVVALAAAAACGGDAPLTWDCCVSGIHYSCTDSGTYGRCVATPPDVTGCTLQSDACPPNSNRSSRGAPVP